MMRILLVGLGMGLLLMACGSGATPEAGALEQLLAQHDSLKAEHNRLTTEHRALLERHDRLVDQVYNPANPNTEINAMLDAHQETLSKHNQVLKTHQELNEQHAIWRQAIEQGAYNRRTLNRRLRTMREDHQRMAEAHEALGPDHERLDAEHDQIMARLAGKN